MSRPDGGGFGYCPPWCHDRSYAGTDDHPAIHTGPLFGVRALLPGGNPVTLFLQPVADYVRGTAVEVVARNLANPRIMVAFGDEPPLFWLPPAESRSTAAALVRMADQLETGPNV
ncbi:MAG: DUF6907 domain-containing protein [Frankiaceae bacterium]